jgi:hypothetical protein
VEIPSPKSIGKQTTAIIEEFERPNLQARARGFMSKASFKQQCIKFEGVERPGPRKREIMRQKL